SGRPIRGGVAVRTKSRTRSIVIWTAVAVIGAVSWAVVALVRGEQISAAWLIAAALGSYAIAYRFYARFIARTVLGVDRRRATPAERLEDDVDFQPTDRRVLFGHHFAAIAGAGPLVGPVLAGQMARDEIGPVGGAAALIAVFAIMIILLAVLALVVVNALAASPWGMFSLT